MTGASGFELFYQAEKYFARGDIDRTFEYYQKSIKKIVRDENITAQMPLPPGVAIPDNTMPTETLGSAWRNFIGFFKDPAMKKNKVDNSPEAYKLLQSYRPNSTYEHTRFRSEKEKLYLKGMQITAGLTLGLLAWDSKDRPTAMKRYREALDLAATHPPYEYEANAREPFERFVSIDVKAARNNLALLFENDKENARLLEMFGFEGKDGRKEMLGIGQVRYEADGSITFKRNVVVASDVCATCGKRDVKLQKCGRCKKASYCNQLCQKADWRMHKPSCIAA
ncbi:uncharacterized protein EV420DRAFT_115373 [Desarmillaria tabescens]|uniref:MYND-type domain-containing protein n=1 Tax=Armillaria tabescens TaxID=1929756 RepID=A0AA39T7U0_ARMTA|nr:uncharacterized protein EV420DRAFT_115373 [Desarmillaria tabescens]KAK0470441.1 hypothetical protein EV420DRAFT_115373 [Desarmillaria tabescens]